MPLAATYIQVQNMNANGTTSSFPAVGTNGTVQLTSGAMPKPTATSRSSGATPIAMAGGLFAGLVIALV